MTTIPEDKLEGIISKGKELEKQLGQENTSEKFVELSKITFGTVLLLS